MGFFCFPSVFSHSCFLVGCLDCLEVEAWQVGPMCTNWGEASPCTQWDWNWRGSGLTLVSSGPAHLGLSCPGVCSRLWGFLPVPPNPRTECSILASNRKV